jgi:hypothetical protein
MNVKGMACKDVNLIHLVENMDQWWSYLNTTMKFWLHKRAECLLAFQGGLWILSPQNPVCSNGISFTSNYPSGILSVFPIFSIPS